MRGAFGWYQIGNRFTTQGDRVALARLHAAAGDAEGDDARLDAWLQAWPREAMLDVLKRLAQGRGQEAERHFRSRHAAWLKAQRLPADPGARRRRVAELRELAESLSSVRQEREARQRAEEEAKRRREREEELRCLMAEVDQRWEAIDAQVTRLEFGAQGTNPRFVVTNLDRPAEVLYDTLYCQRGEAENRIKETQLDLFGTRNRP